jgi:hypothetical protein
MNESVRWIIVLGCLCIAALEAPQCCLQLVQDMAGSYPGAESPSDVPHVGGRAASVALVTHAAQPTASRTEEERALAPSDERTAAGARLASHR